MQNPKSEQQTTVWGGPPPRVRRKPGPLFEAKYGGECTTCGDEFEEGDMIRADGDGQRGYECEACAEEKGGHEYE